MLAILKGVRYMLPYMLDAIEVMLEVLEGARCVLGPMKDVRRVLKVLEVVLKALEVMSGVQRVLWVMGFMHCMLFGILEDLEGDRCLLEVRE